MTTLLLLSILGGYAGCGDCCAKTPRPAECSCQCCGAERVPGCELPPAFRAAPPFPDIGERNRVIDWCRSAGLRVQFVWKRAGMTNNYTLDEIQCGDKP